MDPKGRGHGRMNSVEERRVNRPRSSTRGPLDEQEDPLSATTESLPPNPSRALSPDSASQRPSSSAAQRYAPQFQSPNLLSPRSSHPAARSPTRPGQSPRPFSPSRPELDLSHLLSPSHYQPLPSPPQPFQSRSLALAGRTPIPTLLQYGHFHSAAIAAAEHLTLHTAPRDVDRIFSLLYVRLACLVLLGHGEEAAREAAATIGDWTQPMWLSYAGRRPVNLVPFGLRVLLTRLQAEGPGPAGQVVDPRRAVMGLYELAREARGNVGRISEALKEGEGKLEKSEVEGLEGERRMWKTRLRDLGVTVAGVLVDVGDLEGAGEHLRGLNRSSSAGEDANEQDEGTMAFRRQSLVTEGLVWLRLGGLQAARGAIEGLQEGEPSGSSMLESTHPSTAELLPPLLKAAEGNYPGAVDAWESLHAKYPGNLTIENNLAVCLLYTRQLGKTRDYLTSMLEKGREPSPFPSFLFNLATLLELTTEKARDRKMDVATMLAELEPDSECGGWERAAVELKL
ncbi:hypothetical protein P152DRAFT_458163 [Eremomyces bilateralis CBS 781.70]|uniref:TPR-like protein n=1 Tax=Eremomyces bilateralis CBS 781.70 TaxID=1392243 RepID=A0A6G1G4K4_9PEZI|nr:uncharacterized protein P152DRAFT_458163 [Eremomyces bilateralis CBS 781.70]KAF1812994.1 hypothetical protein P152DRAFT_458163 [Eremomyces bilateralis CBS 781.70]